MRSAVAKRRKTSGAVKGEVVSIRRDGSILVACKEETGGGIPCELLRTSQAPLRLRPGENVLVWLPSVKDERGVILGRVGPNADPAAPLQEMPEELVLEAKQNLTLKVGDGSITLRGDGKILIKGKDLVSHAKRMNRIKGGAVSIN